MWLGEDISREASEWKAELPPLMGPRPQRGTSRTQPPPLGLEVGGGPQEGDTRLTAFLDFSLRHLIS